MKYLFLTAIVAGLCTLSLYSVNANNGATLDQPVELGTVGWMRDLDSAVAKSKKESKPIAMLFQEVPG